MSILATSVGLAACGAATGPVPSTDYPGTYTLQTVNGAAPPAAISQNSQRTIDLLSARVVVRADHSYSLTDNLRITTGAGAAAQADSSSGTWVASGARMTFTPAQAGLLSVTTLDWRAGTLTLTDLGGSVPVTMVFTK